jgi:tetratricopeptide (TPR) repeat protein
MRLSICAGVSALFLGTALLPAGPAFAAGDSNKECPAGQSWDNAQQKCVVRNQSQLENDSIYETGRDLAMAGRYGEAITVLAAAKDKTDPRILNYLGYSHRKQGRVLVGLGYYREAIRSDPNYTLVREYMGEAYLQLGDVAAAREQLSEIENRCGKGCSEYTELSGQIDAYVRKG